MTNPKEHNEEIRAANDRALVTVIGLHCQPGTIISEYHLALIEELMERYYRSKGGFE